MLWENRDRSWLSSGLQFSKPWTKLLFLIDDQQAPVTLQLSARNETRAGNLLLSGTVHVYGKKDIYNMYNFHLRCLHLADGFCIVGPLGQIHCKLSQAYKLPRMTITSDSFPPIHLLRFLVQETPEIGPWWHWCLYSQPVYRLFPHSAFTAAESDLSLLIKTECMLYIPE